ncbi:phage holin family protein [Lysinibacillus sp. 54212]|uniref:phage holin family protein n=1 Tax=Lysinibacillus sp. 54212 TaxID=3119829 RepID=UPI002FC69A6B
MNFIKEYFQLLVANPTAGVIGTGILGVLNFLYGTGITLTVMTIFATVLALDWLAGRAAAKKDGSYASEYGVNGAYRTSFILIILALAYRVDTTLGLPYLSFFYLIGNFGLPMWRSMTANVYRAGWEVWIPQRVLNRVADEIEHKTARANKRLEERRKYGGADNE